MTGAQRRQRRLTVAQRRLTDAQRRQRQQRRPSSPADPSRHDSAASHQIRNLGPVSSSWLTRVGITTTAELIERGAVEVFADVEALPDVHPSLALLWALLGAVDDCDWRSVDEASKRNALAELHALRAQRDETRQL